MYGVISYVIQNRWSRIMAGHTKHTGGFGVDVVVMLYALRDSYLIAESNLDCTRAIAAAWLFT